MENGITRIVAALCAAGSAGLFWTLGVFLAVPWTEGRLLDLSRVEAQLIAVPLLLGSAVAWGALHILAIADLDARPRIYQALVVLFLLALFAAAASGMAWSQAQGVVSQAAGSGR